MSNEPKQVAEPFEEVLGGDGVVEFSIAKVVFVAIGGDELVVDFEEKRRRDVQREA